MSNLPSTIQVQVEAERCKRSLHEFVLRSWHLVQPQTVFVDGWHIGAICLYLEACKRGKIRDLVMNVPPRHMKSLLVNVFFPAWVWTTSPEKKFMCITYAHDLATRDSVLMRNLIASTWYKKRFGVILASDQNVKAWYNNTQGGYRQCFGMEGQITGQGGDFVLIDDPVKVSDADNERELAHVNEIFDNVISTRLNDPKTGVQILIMQRLNQNDLTGHILDRKAEYAWESLILPAEYEVEPRFTSSIGFLDPRTEEGELLWPERFGRDEVDKLKYNLSSALAVAGQFQQRPSPVSGHTFKETWFSKRVWSIDVIARFISCDTAGAVTEKASYSSFAVGELTADYRLFLREMFRDKLEFPQLQYEIERMATKWKPKLNQIVVESKSSGISVIQSLRQSCEPWIADIIYPFNPTTSKVDRASKAAVWCENGSVILPPADDAFPWLFDFEDEMFKFPMSKHKDQVDSFVQLILYCSNYLARGLEARRALKRPPSPVPTKEMYQRQKTLAEYL